eukprot:CAMPEP_0184643296 /NCGR_PEP_ID=MMETSP0308-20130426/113_1 /TAXON_ID=38269 /ORGANISM="Gloeochaete witrockiana, Strain SAG 46.84" /LENGTH=502 /DNA_ID=CAMNT_0027071121 /DNA_START=350 /DNA_END=1858 /DNA_ORIENTATION=-
MTLTRFLLSETRRKGLSEDLSILISSIALACKIVASQVSRAGISDLLGHHGGNQNVHGEDQKKLDVIANEIFKRSLKYSGRLMTLLSEEEHRPVLVDDDLTGHYVAVFDPLDGSSNIDSGVPTGSIFGIYSPASRLTCDLDPANDMAADILRPGTHLAAAGYCLYSSSTTLVITTGFGVNAFTLDPLIGEFVLTRANMRIPTRGSIYSFNEGNMDSWDEGVRSYVQSLKSRRKPYTLRYVGSMVADVHRTLIHGGIFGYPTDQKNTNGKLRLVYECSPMSMIVEQAGGMSSTGRVISENQPIPTRRVLELVPSAVHEKAPIFLGSVEDVKDLERSLDEADSRASADRAAIGLYKEALASVGAWTSYVTRPYEEPISPRPVVRPSGMSERPVTANPTATSSNHVYLEDTRGWRWANEEAFKEGCPVTEEGEWPKCSCKLPWDDSEVDEEEEEEKACRRKTWVVADDEGGLTIAHESLRDNLTEEILEERRKVVIVEESHPRNE